MNDHVKPYNSLDLGLTFLPSKKVIIHASATNILCRKNEFGRVNNKAILASNDHFFYIGVFITLGKKAAYELYVAIYNSQETFMKKPLAGFAVEVKDKVVSIPCKGLPAGTYAFSMYQDENGNGKLDTGAFGIPVETFGFSNDAEGVMGPPSYEKCSITFSEDTTLVVHLK